MFVHLRNVYSEINSERQQSIIMINGNKLLPDAPKKNRNFRNFWQAKITLNKVTWIRPEYI